MREIPVLMVRSGKPTLMQTIFVKQVRQLKSRNFSTLKDLKPVKKEESKS